MKKDKDVVSVVISLIENVEKQYPAFMAIEVADWSYEATAYFFDLLKMLKEVLKEGADNKAVRATVKLLEKHKQEVDLNVIYVMSMLLSVRTILDKLGEPTTN